MKLTRTVLWGVATLVLASTTVLADDAPEVQAAEGPATLVRLEVVMTRSQGDAVVARPDFAELAAAELGEYPQLTGDAAISASDQATQVSDEAREFVLNWLNEAYGVTIE